MCIRDSLSVEVCAVTLTHSFYFYEDNLTFLMGYDLISAAALVIDPVNRCVWSKRSPTAVGSPSSKTDFASCETSVKVVDDEQHASCCPVERTYAVPMKGKPYEDPSCSPHYSGQRADTTPLSPRAPLSHSTLTPEHGLDLIRSPTSSSENVVSSCTVERKNWLC